jgi:hypothetical protein
MKELPFWNNLFCNKNTSLYLLINFRPSRSCDDDGNYDDDNNNNNVLNKSFLNYFEMAAVAPIIGLSLIPVKTGQLEPLQNYYDNT